MLSARFHLAIEFIENKWLKAITTKMNKNENNIVNGLKTIGYSWVDVDAIVKRI